jgi:hypothetical protein
VSRRYRLGRILVPAGPPAHLTRTRITPVLTTADLEEIRQGLRDGLRGPILTKWCEQLLAERDELAARMQAAEDALSCPGRNPGEVPAVRKPYLFSVP